MSKLSRADISELLVRYDLKVKTLPGFNGDFDVCPLSAALRQELNDTEGPPSDMMREKALLMKACLEDAVSKPKTAYYHFVTAYVLLVEGRTRQEATKKARVVFDRIATGDPMNMADQVLRIVDVSPIIYGNTDHPLWHRVRVRESEGRAPRM